jgi:hypothetical protein
MYVRYPLSLRNVEDLLAERGIDISHETVRFWWNRFGPMFAAEIRKKRIARMRGYPQWRWHLDEVFVKVNGKRCYLWRAVDHEGEGHCHVVEQECERPASRVFSSGRNGRAPRVHRRGAEGAVRSGRCEVALDVEGVVDGGMDREEFLGGAWAPETLHLALPSSGRLMRILCPIVLPPTALMTALDPEIVGGGAIGPQVVGD